MRVLQTGLPKQPRQQPVRFRTTMTSGSIEIQIEYVPRDGLALCGPFGRHAQAVRAAAFRLTRNISTRTKNERQLGEADAQGTCPKNRDPGSQTGSGLSGFAQRSGHIGRIEWVRFGCSFHVISWLKASTWSSCLPCEAEWRPARVRSGVARVGLEEETAGRQL